jgi:zinc protease
MRSLFRARRVSGLFALTPAAILAQTSTGPLPFEGTDQPLPFDTAVTVGTLPNGMRYYLRVNREPERRAELRLVVRAGSIHEADDQRGLAHFLEHMAFNGTVHFARQQLVEYLESIGMRFGGDVNANTTYDHTLYRLTVPTDVPDALERVLLIVEDWAHGLTLDREAIDSERNVVLAEWRSRLGVATRVRVHADSLLLAGSRYLEPNPIGLPERIETAQRAELARFYNEWYRPDRMALVVVGDIDEAVTEALIRRRFAGLSASRKPQAFEEPGIPDRRGPAVTVITDPEATTWSVQLLRRYRPSPVNTAARAREELIEGLFESILDRRLHEIATKAEAPFLGAGTDVTRFVGEPAPT